MNKFLTLHKFGQSFWLDNLTRSKITSGELKKRVDEEGLLGITTNPAIFNKAISGSCDYDEQIKQLHKDGKTVEEIYKALTIKDVQDACDVLYPVYEKSGKVDGFVSLEVSPYLARNAEGTITEARELFKLVDRSNCFIKIPGTKEGLQAIGQALYEGININITLLFSIKSYEDVAVSYINALKRRSSENKSISDIRSVASFFISRIDTLVDDLLSIAKNDNKYANANAMADQLSGVAGVASAKLAYQSFKKIFSGEKWQSLVTKGAKVQRPLWASTSTKNPAYRDVLYVESLIGRDTVNTMPDETIVAFQDHGVVVEDSIEKNVDSAKSKFDSLKNAGIDIDYVTERLVNEGIEKFVIPYDNLLKTIAEKLK